MLRTHTTLLLACLPSLVSCVYSRLDGSTEPSRAFDRPELTEGGARVLALAANHPGDSGLYSLASGLDARFPLVPSETLEAHQPGHVVLGVGERATRLA